jgi:hypothetical protein
MAARFERGVGSSTARICACHAGVVERDDLGVP